jgi:hypothetical protein
MPPARKAAARNQNDLTLDPALQSPVHDDPVSNEAGPSKRAKPAAKTKTTKMSAERKEANRLAAERSRVRRAERANILEQTAKGLAEENLVLKERIRKLVAMGVGVDLAGDHSAGSSDVDRSVILAPSQPRESQESARAATNILPVPPITGADSNTATQSRSSLALHRKPSSPLLERQRSDHTAPHNDTSTDLAPRTNNTSSLHQEMEAYFRQQVEQLKLLLHEKSGQLGSDDISQDVVMSDQTNEVGPSNQSEIEQYNDRLLREVQVLHEVVLRVKADRTKAQATNDRLKAQIKAAEAQLLVRDNIARTEDEAVVEIEERRLETQKAFKDVKRHLGLLIGVRRLNLRHAFSSLSGFPSFYSTSTQPSSSLICRSKRRLWFPLRTKVHLFRNHRNEVVRRWRSHGHRHTQGCIESYRLQDLTYRPTLATLTMRAVRPRMLQNLLHQLRRYYP